MLFINKIEASPLATMVTDFEGMRDKAKSVITLKFNYKIA